MLDPLISAISIAFCAHQRQLDKAGMPYFGHCLRVLDQVKVRLPDDIDAQCAAVLHDVLEDSPLNGHDLRKFGVAERVIELVVKLTKQATRGDMTYHEWIRWIAAQPDRALPIIKLADLRDNGSPARLAMIPDVALRERLRVKYDIAQLAIIENL